MFFIHGVASCELHLQVVSEGKPLLSLILETPILDFSNPKDDSIKSVILCFYFAGFSLSRDKKEKPKPMRKKNSIEN